MTIRALPDDHDLLQSILLLISVLKSAFEKIQIKISR